MIEQYKQMRVNNQFDLNWFYRYFLEQGGQRISAQEFNLFFQMGDLNEVVAHLDRKFNLTKVVDKDNKLIKIL